MESTRPMKILYYLAQNMTPVTSAELAEYAGVSERTIKNDLDRLRDLAQENGCSIQAQRGRGYWLQIEDPEKFGLLETQLNYRFSRHNFTLEYEDRANQIVRILLVHSDYVKLDDIAEQLYVSRSSLKNIMPDVRAILRDFKLELLSKPGHGLKIQGEEINIRFCMLELFIDHDYRSVPAIENEEYLAYFTLEGVDIGELRHHFLKVLRESGTRIVDNNTHRLVRYIFLLYQRFLQGYRLQFQEEDVLFLRNTGEYTTAKDILDTLEQEDTGIGVDEMEILGLELLLLLWNDLNESDDLEGRYPLFYQKVQVLVDKILLRIRDQWGIDLGELDGIRQSLSSAIIPNYTKIYFGFLGYNRTIGKKVENNMMSSSPVCLALAMTAADVIREACGLELSRADIFNYTVRFYIAVARIHYDYVPRRVLISAQSGNESCTIIRDQMIRRFGTEVFERLDTINSYEIRRINQKDYDYLILNFAPHYYRYDLPVIYVDSIPNEQQLNQIYYQVILGGYQLRDPQALLSFGKDFVFPDFPYQGRDNFLNLLCYKYCGGKDIAAMTEYLKRYTDVCVWNGTASLVVDSRYTGQNLCHLYCLSSPGVWEKKTVKYILFVSVNFRKEKKSLKYLEQLTHEMVNNPRNMEKLASIQSMNQFYEIVKHGLTLGQ